MLKSISNEKPFLPPQGMGEPLNNYNAVRDAVSMMTHSQVFGLSRKHVTVSTVGVVPRLRDMANDMPVSQKRSRRVHRYRQATSSETARIPVCHCFGHYFMVMGVI